MNGIKKHTCKLDYDDNRLACTLTPEGRVMANPDGTFNYRYFLEIGAQRKSYLWGNHVGWSKIYNEFLESTGPERSIFEGDHPSNLAIKKNYLYKNAYEDFQESGNSKGSGKVNF